MVSRIRKLNISMVPFAPENLVSRDGFGLFRRFDNQGICEMVWMGAGDSSLLIYLVYKHYLY